METKTVAIGCVGLLLVFLGVGYYMGWWDELSSFIPWFADKGDLKVLVYDAMQTADTSDDIPLANVTISILSTELVKLTDQNGTALFEGVEVGEYEVQADWNGTIESKNVTITKGTITIVTFLFNETTS